MCIGSHTAIVIVRGEKVFSSSSLINVIVDDCPSGNRCFNMKYRRVISVPAEIDYMTS